MNHNHLKKLINLGFLVDEKVLERVEKLNEEEFYKLVEKLKEKNLFIVNNEILKIVFGELKILKKFKKLKKFNVQDFVKNLNKKYDFLQDILVKKLELSNIVSINKCSVGTVSVIGLVRDIEKKGDDFVVSLEDPTGELKALITKKLGEKIDLDDVIAVSGKFNNNLLFADKVLFPSVPLKSATFSESSIKVAFLSEEKNVEADYLIYKDRIKNMLKNEEYKITNPCIFKINDIIFLLLLGYEPFDALRKRYIKIENTDFLIDYSPDIVLTDKGINTNYKGVSIVSFDSIIDLKTREIKVL